MKMAISGARQTSLKAAFSFQGKGLHTGIVAELRALPAPANHGVVFQRVDLPGKPKVKADLDSVTATERGTVLKDGEASAATVEHFLGALYGLGIDNVLVELSGPEVPISDGSGLEFLQLIRSAGLAELEAPRRFLELPRPFELRQDGKWIEAKPSSELEVAYRIDYHHPHLGQQEFHLVLSPEGFAESIGPARTFCFEFEIEGMRKAGLIKGGGPDCALVIGEKGLINPPLRYPDEFVRHKVLDFLGDLSLIGGRVKAAFSVERAGHGFHVQAIRALKEKFFQSARRSAVSESAVSNPVLLDVNAIQELLPHRYPMLLVDRVTALELKKSITALKSVTMNEWFFQGHFPGSPIYPGVLIVEGLAQAGGLLIMKSYPELLGMLTYFMAIDNARFRRPVVPGDQLRYEVSIEKTKGPVTRFKGLAYVGADLAAEAELMCMVAEKK